MIYLVVSINMDTSDTKIYLVVSVPKETDTPDISGSRCRIYLDLLTDELFSVVLSYLDNTILFDNSNKLLNIIDNEVRIKYIFMIKYNKLKININLFGTKYQTYQAYLSLRDRYN